MNRQWSSQLAKTFAVSIVDDDESVREGLVSLMRSYGYIATSFDCAENFLQSGSGSTDCLIADMHMPGMSGIELFNRLAVSGRTIPTILITARHEEGVRAQASRAGVLCYLPKPFKEDELLKCIHAAMTGRR
jgi:FixJ family two-component response regulator